MVSRFVTVELEAYRRSLPAVGETNTPLKWGSQLGGLVALVTICLMVFIVVVVAVARAQPIPQILYLSQTYQPGNLPPDDLKCGLSPRCWVDFQGHRVYFDFDADTSKIIRTVIPTEKYTLGELMVSWGMPVGISWNHYTVYLYWPSHWIILSNKTFRPTSPVKSILYTLEQPPSSPWNGFRREVD